MRLARAQGLLGARSEKGLSGVRVALVVEEDVLASLPGRAERDAFGKE